MKAAALAHALGFKRSGHQWLGCCVAHDDRNPSMIIFDGDRDVQVRCLAGCSSDDIIEALRARGVWQGGGWNSGAITDAPLDDAARIQRDREIAERDRKRSALAIRIWEDAVNPEGTPVEDYLAGRGLIWPDRASSIIRYHPRCPKGPAGSVEYVPALIALMRDVETFEPCAIQRIFLEQHLTWVKAGAMMLGLAGNAAMMITSRHDTFWDDLSFCPRLAICEGLETGLAINRNARCVWALGSAGAIGRFPVIFGVGHIVICADNDADNLDSGFVAAIDCARRWNASSHQRATIMMPNLAGADFADCPIEV